MDGLQNKYSESDKQGLEEFFKWNETNKNILMSIAITLSNLKDISLEYALDVVLIQSSGVIDILSRDKRSPFQIFARAPSFGLRKFEESLVD